jgi:hypothetical protein
MKPLNLVVGGVSKIRPIGEMTLVDGDVFQVPSPHEGGLDRGWESMAKLAKAIAHTFELAHESRGEILDAH